jgi:hypothetical protein
MVPASGVARDLFSEDGTEQDSLATDHTAAPGVGLRDGRASDVARDRDARLGVIAVFMKLREQAAVSEAQLAQPAPEVPWPRLVEPALQLARLFTQATQFVFEVIP